MFVLSDLPYRPDALEPTMSADTVRTHHGKHHAKYVEVTNQLLQKAGGPDRPLEQVVVDAARAGERKLFNNAAQAWNHGFFWESMTATRSDPDGALAAAIQRDFGDLGKLREAFVTEGVGHFASGWVWLVLQDGRLHVISTHDADDTLPQSGITPLLVCDLWEHAYYLDYKNDRKTFLEAWFDKLACWPFAGRQLAAAQAGEPGWRYPAPVREPA
jgi:Fe-Mn family superoxide dismutase